MTPDTVIEFARLQYRTHAEFRLFTDDWLTEIRAKNPDLPLDAQACFAMPVNGVGTPLASFILEGYEARVGKRPYSSG